MSEFTTLRIYFEKGQRMKHPSFWRKLYAQDFSTELIKRAKGANLKQVLHLHVDKGYFHHQKVNWGVGEMRHYHHPHLIEIIDSPEKIDHFLEDQADFLKGSIIAMVKGETLLP